MLVAIAPGPGNRVLGAFTLLAWPHLHAPHHDCPHEAVVVHLHLVAVLLDLLPSQARPKILAVCQDFGLGIGGIPVVMVPTRYLHLLAVDGDGKAGGSLRLRPVNRLLKNAVRIRCKDRATLVDGCHVEDAVLVLILTHLPGRGVLTMQVSHNLFDVFGAVAQLLKVMVKPRINHTDVPEVAGD